MTFMEFHKSFMEFHKSFMEFHKSFMEFHKSFMEFHKCSHLWNSINHLWNSINHLWNSINHLWNSINAYFRALRLAIKERTLQAVTVLLREYYQLYIYRYRLSVGCTSMLLSSTAAASALVPLIPLNACSS